MLKLYTVFIVLLIFGCSNPNSKIDLKQNWPNQSIDLYLHEYGLSNLKKYYQDKMKEKKK